MKEDNDINFATTNLNILVERKTGVCSTCVNDKKEKEICEHGHCQNCQCKHYCWLD